MFERTREIAVGLGTLIIGAIIGVIIEDGINRGFSNSALALLVLCVALFAGTAIWAASAKEQSQRMGTVAQSLRDVEKRLGLQVTLQELRVIGDPGVHQEDHLLSLVKEAEFEILEVNRSAAHEPPQNPEIRREAIKLRKEYYETILKRVAVQGAKKGSFTYKRIEQFDTEQGRLSSLQDAVYVDHLRRMMELQRDTRLNIYVKKALLAFPISFMMLDREYLVITFDGVSHVNGEIRFFQKSELIIKDPQRELINVFLREWDRIENSPTTRTANFTDF